MARKSNPFGKTISAEAVQNGTAEPYATYRAGALTWKVLKTWQRPDKEKGNQHARWFVLRMNGGNITANRGRLTNRPSRLDSRPCFGTACFFYFCAPRLYMRAGRSRRPQDKQLVFVSLCCIVIY